MKSRPVTPSIVLALASLTAGVLTVLSPVSRLARADKPRVIVFPGLDASTFPRAPDAGEISRIPPDPTPMVSRKQWVFDLRWSKGEPYLLAIHPLDVGTPQETPRVMGRFALELYEGPTLIERVRFDFPMLGADEQLDAGRHAAPSFQRNLTSRIGVMFPATNRGTRLDLWDRATDNRWPLPWPPPDEPAPAPSATPAPAPSP